MEQARQSGPTLPMYVAVLRRRKWIILFCAVWLPAAAVYFSLLKYPEYRATAEVYITNQVPFGIPGVENAGLFGNEPIETQASLARVPEVARIALRRAALSDRTPGELLSQSGVVAKERLASSNSR